MRIVLFAVPCLLFACASLGPGPPADLSGELAAGIRPVPGLCSAAEAYFSPDGSRIVCNANFEPRAPHHTVTIGADGSAPVRINDRGEDACSFFTPDGRAILFTSTCDHPEMPAGSWHDANDYPQGAEIYLCDLDGGNRRRLTDNRWYDAEVTMSPDGRWVLFARQQSGRLDLFRMRPDGTRETRITDTPEWQEGGSFYLPDGETILYRAWKLEDQGKTPKPMALFTMKDDGSDVRLLTPYDGRTSWSPYPAPDGHHCVFAKVFPGPGGRPNFEIVWLDMETGDETRLTDDPAFDGFPTLSADGRTLLYSSSRGPPPGERGMNIYTMDLGPLLDRLR
jgi:Tol biopolymer transport system component